MKYRQNMCAKLRPHVSSIIPKPLNSVFSCGLRLICLGSMLALFAVGESRATCSKWLNLETGVDASVIAKINGTWINFNTPASCTSDSITWSFTEGDITLTKTSTSVEAELTTATSGDFRWGIQLRCDDLTVQDGPQTDITPSTTTVGTLSSGIYYHSPRYPYDWDDTKTGVNYVAYIDQGLIMPGLYSGSNYYISDTKRLTEIAYDWPFQTNYVRAIFYEHVEENDDYDIATYDLSLSSSETRTITLDIDSDLEDLQDTRFGAPTSITGDVTQTPFKAWADVDGSGDPEFPNLSTAQYTEIAEGLAGSYDYVILRTLEPSAAITSIFHDEGLEVFYYMFWGAVRNTHPDVATMDADWFLEDSAGDEYTAPKSDPKGNWDLLNVRDTDVRDYFIDRAVEAVNDFNFDGIFLDGPLHWRAKDGHVGGDVPGATDSWSYARWLLLDEMRVAVRVVDSSLHVGMLQGRYYWDHMHTNDYLLKENVNFKWNSVTENPYYRESEINDDHGNQWIDEYEPYIKTNLAHGSKGVNPLLLETARRWSDPGTRSLNYNDIGDFFAGWKNGATYTDYTTHMVDMLAGVADHQGSWITTVASSTADTRTLGPSRTFTDVGTTLTFNRALPVWDETLGTATAPSTTLMTVANRVYRIAERKETSDWYWTNYGFAYLDETSPVHASGEVRFPNAPVETANDIGFTIRPAGDGVVSIVLPNKPTSVELDEVEIYETTDWTWNSTTKTFTYTVPANIHTLDLFGVK